MTRRRAGPRAGILAAALLLAFVPACAALRAAREPVYAHGAVAADHEIASAAGVEMLRRGGNAVDAAVATSFCLSVVRPFSCGIGGGGFMVIYDAGDGDRAPLAVAIDYRETTPRAVGPSYDTELGDALAARTGFRAAGVPGTVAGLLLALERFGTLDRATVLAPAIRAAERGFVADRAYAEAVNGARRRAREAEPIIAAAPFVWQSLCGGGELRAGDRIVNARQAEALRLIAEHGADAFYRGPIGAAIAAAMARHGGPMTAEDLASYAPRVTSPLRVEVHLRDPGGARCRYELIGMPPPSSGGIAIAIALQLLDRLDLDPRVVEHSSPEYVHLVAESLKEAFADRARWLADPAFAPVPVERLLDPALLDARAARIDRHAPRPPAQYGLDAVAEPPPEDGGTSHLSVIDRRGMAVACTETINLEFGALVGIPEFGFALNDEMDDFTTAPGEANAFGLRQSEWNRPEPGKRPLSSMSPTIVLRDGRPLVVAGGSGGPRIISGTLETLLGCLLYGRTPAEAVAPPRFHHQWLPDRLEFERSWTDPATIDALAQRGHATGMRDDVGVVQIIGVAADGIRAASDPRKGGRAHGY
jgi:gamma-glutamyltranspeptidase/glutathione hydrolase